jgi:hypothetical protein
MARPVVQQAPPPTLPVRTSLIQSAYPNVSFAGDTSSYDYMTAVHSYEPSLFYGGNVQPSVQPSQHVAAGFPTFPSSVGSAQHSYVVPLTELGQQPEDYSYSAEQYGYNDDDFQDNALSYELGDVSALPRLAARDVFLSGGETSSVAVTSQPAPIMPGFFSNPVKQKLDEKFALPTVTQASTKMCAEQTPQTVVSSSNDKVTGVTSSGLSSVSIAKSAVITSSAATSHVITGRILSPPKSVVSQTPVASVSQPATTVAAATKTVFGGFSFTSTPVIAESKGSNSEAKKDAKKEETKPVNPFASFSFNQSATKSSEEKKEVQPTTVFGGFKFTSPSAASKPPAKADAKDQPLASSSQPVFGTASTSEVPSFSSLAAQTGSTTVEAFAKKADGRGAFQGAGEQVFKGFSKSPTSGARTRVDSSGKPGEDDEDGAGEEYVPDQEFKPLVSLPEVEVKTGEEDEVKLFGERAKLYRMDPESKSWKERGLGEMKILRHPETGRCRIVMRREQVLKLCANHIITASMKLVPMKTSETSLCWFANDYSEGEFSEEQLCVKFKTVEQFQKFKSCFEECQAALSHSQAKSTGSVLTAETKANEERVSVSPAKNSSHQTSAPPTAVESAPLASLFMAKAGQWDCTGCYVRNDAEKAKCVACNTPKPGSDPVSSSSNVKPVPMSSVSVAANVKPASGGATKTDDSKPLSALFQAKAGQWDCTGCYIRNEADKTACVACLAPRPGSTPASNTSAVSQSTSAPAAESQFKLSASGGFTFGASTTPFKFTGFGSNLVNETAKSSAASETTAAVKPLFTASFGQGTTTPATTSSTGVSSTSSFTGSFSFKPFQATSASVSANATPAPAPVFTFGSAGSTKSGSASAVAAKTNLFQTSASTPSFALLAESSATKPGNSSVLTDSAKQGFGSQSFVFKGVTSSMSSSLSSLTAPSSSPLQPASATPTKKVEQAPVSPSSPDGNELYVTGADDEPNVTFEPVCTLPDNVEVKTGEEDEDVLYEHRAKLYRFAESEWKERGTGDVKILKHRETGVVRIVMRRERVLKICLNHRILVTMNLQPMPSAQGKAWMWYATDFADGPEPTNEKFSLKFKTEEIADSFKKAFDDAKDIVSRAGPSQASVTQTSVSEKADVCTGRSILAGLLTGTLKETPGKLLQNVLLLIVGLHPFY